MNKTLSLHLPYTDGTITEYCQSLAGTLLVTGQYDTALEVITLLAELGHSGYLPANLTAAKKKTPDITATLWFIHAGHSYYSYTHDQATWVDLLLPLMKRISQNIIGGHFRGTRMGDGGLLDTVPALEPMDLMLTNILWDNALATLAAELRRVHDHTGDHFERLGNRFKRSFLKMYWSDSLGYLTPPVAVPETDRGAAEGPVEAAAPASLRSADAGRSAVHAPPDPCQLLAPVLPASSVPRTKQGQMVDLFRRRDLSPWGVRTTWRGGTRKSPLTQEVFCPLYLAWLAEGHVRTSDTPATAVAEAQDFLRHLHGVLENEGTLSRYYTAEGLAEVKGNVPAHGPTMAEVRRVWRGLQAAAEKPIGNSKRTRITGALMPGTERGS